MYVRQVQIENVRCFGADSQRVELDLQRPDGRFAGWTVFAGLNGSGKTTLLKSIALAALGPHGARALAPSLAGWVRRGSDTAHLAIEIDADRADRFEHDDTDESTVSLLDPAGLGLSGGRVPPFRADLDFNLAPNNGPEPSLRPGEGARSHPFCDKGPWSENPRGWFLAGYGPFRRIYGASTDSQRLMAGPPRLSRLVSLFREDAALGESVEWLKSVYLRRLEAKPGAKQIEEGVIALLNDGLLPGGMRVDRVDSDGLWTERAGVKLPLRGLSDGYGAVAGLVLDIIKQLHDCYGTFDFESSGSRPIVTSPGVVLIDEADIHLHVSWQQRLGFWLKEHFPNIQFLVTTHSPFICQAADPRGLIRLPAPGSDERVDHLSEELFKTVVQGGADDAILTGLFGLEHTHSEASEALRRRIADLETRSFRGSGTPEEETELAHLRTELPRTGNIAIEQALRNVRAAE